MNFDFDDNLNDKKRKNRNPVQTTNLLIVAGFIALGIMIVFFMNDNNSSSTAISNAEIEATVDAKLSDYLAQQTGQSPVATQDQSQIKPTIIPATIAPRPKIEGTELISGGVVENTITSEEFEIHYTYEGKANTPIIITIQGAGLSEPAVILTNPYGNRIVASGTANQTIGDDTIQVIGAVLPVDGQYIITATRRGGRAGNASGDFQLTLEIPKLLDPESRVSGVAESTGWQWHVVQQEHPFSITYSQQKGAYTPEIGVYHLDSSSSLSGLAYLVGNDEALSFGTLGRFDPDDIYFIAVGRQTLQTVYDVPYLTTEYTLGVQISR